MNYILILLYLIKIVYGESTVTSTTNIDELSTLNPTTIASEIDIKDSLESVETSTNIVNFSKVNINRKYLKGI